MDVTAAATALRGWLEWYRDMGAAALVGEQPANRFHAEQAELPAPAPRRANQPAAAISRRDSPVAIAPPVQRAATARPAAAVLQTAAAVAQSAREIAAACTSLAELEAALATFDGCGTSAH